MTKNLSIRFIVLIFSILFLLPSESQAVKPIGGDKELDIDDEQIQSKRLSVFNKLLNRKILKRAKKNEEVFEELEYGHWSLIFGGASVLLFGVLVFFGSSVLFSLALLIWLLSFGSAIASIFFGRAASRDKKAGLTKQGYKAGAIGSTLGVLMSLVYLILVLAIIVVLISL